MENAPSTAIKLSGEIDTLFAATPYPHPFAFTHEVAQVFDDMISRSIPFYRDVIALISRWAQSHPPQAGQRIYDIGCSTGTTLFALGASLDTPCELVGLDTSEPMLARAAEKLAPLRQRHRIDLQCITAESAEYQRAHLVLLNYTLQFIPLVARQSVLERIYRGMDTGGMLFISEKLLTPSALIHETYTEHYESFKREAGYSQGEIARKKAALDQVLIPLSLAEHQRMLQAAGFTTVEVVFKWQNFATLIALKD
jgi:tRNA (cmo5U34)-methyltransferase